MTTPVELQGQAQPGVDKCTRTKVNDVAQVGWVLQAILARHLEQDMSVRHSTFCCRVTAAVTAGQSAGIEMEALDPRAFRLD